MAKRRCKREVYYVPQKERHRTFINDEDGLSAKDYLLITSTAVFFIFISVALLMLLLGKEIDQMYLSLLDTMVPVLMTVVGGVMGVQAVESYTNRGKKHEEVDRDSEY